MQTVTSGTTSLLHTSVAAATPARLHPHRHQAASGRANVSTHLEDELAPEMARLAHPMGVTGLGQAIERDLRSAYGPGKKQLGDALQRLAGASDRRPERR